MLVSPPPPCVPRWIVTNSRKMFFLPMTTRVFSPRYLRSCGIRPIEANGKICVSSPISVQPSMSAEAPIRQCLPMRTCGPIVANGPTMVPSPISAFGWTMARGSIVRRAP